MQDHPQIRAFSEAAQSLRAERYWRYASTEELAEFLRALGDVLTEVSYQLDANAVLPPAVLEVWQAMAVPVIRNLPLPPSAGTVLMSYLECRIDGLIAAQGDSGNTGAEGGRSA
ncbi:hypothetical protein [Arthrobacter sp. UYEF21]|uniref:hypothetical protein n=1 Tax=Arthrobacter sp. UYEF21 TaxID=1756364 RepID=UPI003391D6EA